MTGAGSGEGRRHRERKKAPGGKGGEEATIPWRRSGGVREGRGGSDDARGRGRDEDVLPLPRHRFEFTTPRPLHANPPLRRRHHLLLCAGRVSIAASSSLTTAMPPPPPPPASHLLAACAWRGLQRPMAMRIESWLVFRVKESGHRHVALFIVSRQ